MASPAKKKKNRSRLGRGIGVMLDPGVPAIEVAAELSAVQKANIVRSVQPQQLQEIDQGSVERVIEIGVDLIVPNQHQPRRHFDEQALEELAGSIAEHGLMQPIVVRQADGVADGDGGDGGGVYELIAGERRWRATCRTGAETIRAIVMVADDFVSAQLALIENIQREDLNPIERARGFWALSDGFGMTQEQISTKVGVSRSAVANFLRLMELDDEIQMMIASGLLGAGHGKALLSCRDEQERLLLAKLADKEGWTVRILEQRAIESNKVRETNIEPGGANTQTSQGGAMSRVESVLQDLERRLGEKLSTRVQLKTDKTGTKGSISIEFYDLDHFEGLMDRLGMNESGEINQGV